MREIKFRIWDERAKQYADTKKCVYIVGVLHNNKIVLGFDSPKAEYSLGLVLEQFTGLLDKNGKEIYDGDILKVFVNKRVPTPENERKCEWDTVRLVPSFEEWTVEYCERYSQGNGFYCFGKNRRFNTFMTKSKLYNTKAEIIGNIHDNPELLKGDNNV